MKPNIKVEHVNIEETEDDIEPPPPNIKSTFNTLEDWLINICESAKPQSSIATYAFGIFESQNDRVLTLVGLNKYFLLPKETYNDLTQAQLVEKLTNQLREFTKTKKFEDSFLADSISILLNAKPVWTK